MYLQPRKYGLPLGRRLSEAQCGDDRTTAQVFTLILQPADQRHFSDDDSIYSYAFRPPERQDNDDVLILLRRAIHDLEIHPQLHLLMCNQDFSVVPLTTAPSIWPPDSKDDNHVKMYTFSQDGVEFPATMPVRIMPRGNPTVDTLHVAWNARWITITSWLLEIANPGLVATRPPHEVTHYWWCKNGKKFELLKLPAEIKLEIFAYVVENRWGGPFTTAQLAKLDI